MDTTKTLPLYTHATSTRNNRYKYEQFSITLNPHESGIAHRGLEEMRERCPDHFKKAQLKTVSALMKAVALRCFQDVIKTGEQMKNEREIEEGKEYFKMVFNVQKNRYTVEPIRIFENLRDALKYVNECNEDVKERELEDCRERVRKQKN